MMIPHKESNQPTSLVRVYLPWIILYLVIISGAVAFGASQYSKYNENHLPSGHIELRVNKHRYQPGEVVKFTVINNFPTTIYISNECPGEPLNVYRWEKDKWLQLHGVAKNEDSECFRQPRNIPILAGASRDYNFADWPNLFKEAGVYRLAAVIDHYSDIPFQDFVILEPAPIIKKQKAAILPVSVPIPPIISHPEEVIEEDISLPREDLEREEEDEEEFDD